MPALTKKDRQGLMLMGAVAVLMIALFALSARLSDKPKLDERSCQSSITRKTAILIDRSDDAPTQTVDEIVSRVKGFVSDRAQEGELVSLFEVSGQSRTSLAPVFSACVPRRDGNDLYENRRKIQRYFDQRFARPLERALSRASVQSDSSPISEAIIDLSASSYLDAGANRLIVFSDLLQHSANASLYGCSDAKDAIAAFRANRAGAIERPTFRNTAVELNVIPREGVGAAGVRCRDGFWTWFLGDAAGPQAGVEIRMLPGGARVQ